MIEDAKRPYQVRDDNLRLIFADAEREALRERLLDIEAGVVLLTIFSVAVLFGFVALAGVSAPLSPVLFLYGAALTVGAGVILVSPIILIGLWIERRRAQRDIREHHTFLKSYNRDFDEPPGQ